MPKAAKIPPLYAGLLAASCLIFSGLLIATVIKMRENTARDQELAVEQSKNMTETDRKAAEALLGYKRSVIEAREAKAKQSLAKARAAMARVGNSPANTPEATLALNEAFVGYNGYLEVLPDDADVRVERARTHQLRRNYDLAIADLERAAQLKPETAKACQDQIAQLRLFLARERK
jgi:tetratricopeptide (TPR) repeat protein